MATARSLRKSKCGRESSKRRGLSRCWSSPGAWALCYFGGVAHLKVLPESMPDSPESMPDSIDALLKWRAEFPILERSTYMISNSLGAMPRGVYESLRGYADSWATRGVKAWEEGWWEMAVGVGDKIAPLIGAGT